MDESKRIVWIDGSPEFKPGDPPPFPDGYEAWHEWAQVQVDAGIKQKFCPKCKLWRFPQETHSHTKKDKA